MNKFVKLPLFLAVVGGVCTAVLATTYELTNPIKVARENAAKEAAFKEILADFGLLNEEGKIKDGVDPVEYTIGADDSNFELSSKLANNGYSRKVLISQNEVLVGAFYEGSVVGYGGDINFQLSFKDGLCHSFVCLSHNETDGFGKDLLASLPEALKGKEVSYFQTSTLNTDFASGVTVTSTYLMPALAAAAKDYSAAMK